MMKPLTPFLHTLALWALVGAGSARALSLEDYRRQVYDQNPSLQAVAKRQEAAALKARSAELPTTIQLFSDSLFTDDTRYTSSPTFMGNRTTYFNTGVGLKQQTPFGLSWSLSQNLSRTKIYGVSPLLLPQPLYWDAYPKVEARVSLWKNFGGSEIRAQKRVLSRMAEMLQVSTKIEKIQKDIEIESAFYKYGIQKNIFALSEKNLDRTQRLFRWVGGRQSKNLVDDSDFLQVKASVALRELEYDRAKRSYDLALREFNNLLENENSDSAPDVSWRELDPREFVDLSRSKKLSLLDLMKQKDLERSQAQAVVEAEAVGPVLDLFGGSTFQGRDRNAREAFGDLNEHRKNVWSLGLNFSVPIDFGLLGDVKKAARLEEEAAGAKLRHQAFDQRLSWTNFQAELLRCSQSLRLLGDLEEAQQKRFAAEESKYKKGRSTLFQVLIAEQDFINSQAQKFGNELQCFVVKAQSPLYYGEGETL